MIQFTISITKENVLNEVATIAEYMASRAEDNDDGDRDRISTSDKDAELLERYWNEACAVINGTVKNFSPVVDNSFAGYSVTLSMASNFDTTQEYNITRNVCSFFIDYLMANWSQIVKKDARADYKEKAAMELQEIRRGLYSRTRPTRTNV